MNIIANSVDILDVKKSCVNACNKCLELETELFKKKDFVEKEAYDKLVKSYSNLENIAFQYGIKHLSLIKRDFQGKFCNALVKHSVRNAKFESMCAICNKCLFEANHGSSKKAKIVESDTANNSESTHLWGSNATDVPSSSSLVNDKSSRSSSELVRFKNDHVAKIMGYDDYQQGNVIISRVYYVEGLRHNLFYVGQFCDADLEVAFRKNTCFIRNLEGVDLLSGSHDTNLYIISLDDMLKTFNRSDFYPRASKTNSWK
ncbi:hypothetical protein Tco_0662560 [Tanacetum coccineum]